MYIIAHYETNDGTYTFGEYLWYEGKTEEECLSKARGYLTENTDEDDNILYDKEGNVIGVDYSDNVIKLERWVFYQTRDELAEAILKRTQGF